MTLGVRRSEMTGLNAIFMENNSERICLLDLKLEKESYMHLKYIREHDKMTKGNQVK